MSIVVRAVTPARPADRIPEYGYVYYYYNSPTRRYFIYLACYVLIYIYIYSLYGKLLLYVESEDRGDGEKYEISSFIKLIFF